VQPTQCAEKPIKASEMNTWKIESNRNKQTAMMLGLTAVGLVLTIKLTVGHGASETAGFLLGLLMMVLGAVGLYMGTTRAVVVDPKSRLISIEDTNRIGQRKRSIPFKDVADAYVDKSGDRDSGSIAYDVMLKLRSGKTVALFAGAVFDGRHDQAVMAERCRLIGQYLQQA
jgi:hypothetical protein